MALIIEDGTQVENANAYGSVADLRTYAALRGVVLPEADADCEVLIIKAMDYIDAQRDRFQGAKVSSTQALQWPRSGVYIDNALVQTTTIPRELEYALYALAIESQANDLQPNELPGEQGQVIREKVEGAVEVAYANPTTRRSTPAFAKADALLSPLYKRNGLFAIRT